LGKALISGLKLKETSRDMNKVKVWLNELRAPFLTGTIVPIVLGTVIAWTRNSLFNPVYFVIALMGGIFVHLGANVVNDYYDYKSGNDQLNKEFVRPFTGGSRSIPLGLLTPKEVLSGAIVLFALATAVGIFFTLVVGSFMIVLAAFGLFSAFFYTGRPLSLADKGLGELFVGVNFGLLMTLGAFYVQTGALAVEPLVAAVPVGLLIIAILYINAFQDYTSDKAVGKRTLIVRLGRQKAADGYALLMGGTYAAILVAALLNITPVYTLLALLTLPLAVKSVRHARQFHSSPFQLVPSNALTIVCHLFTGILLILGYLLSAFALLSVGFLAVLVAVGVCTGLAFLLFGKIAYGKKPA
jgi:1,4-dihydroxy-2-naphthoate octaprenyltransferase